MPDTENTATQEEAPKQRAILFELENIAINISNDHVIFFIF